MLLQGARRGEAISRRTRRGDRAMQALILGSGVVVLLTPAWVHLGLGAALVAPAATPPRMVASAGAYTVTMYANSGQLVAGDGNVVEFDLRNHEGQPVTNATVRIHADMMTMAMPVPDVYAVAQSGGKYHARQPAGDRADQRRG